MQNMQTPFPEEFIKKLAAMLPEENMDQTLSALCNPRSLSIRVNTLKSSVEEITQLLTQNNILFSTISWYPHAFLVQTTTDILTALPAYHEGKFYIQGLSSMVPAVVLDPHVDEKILDIAAAPGSKTTQLAMQMNNQGELVANDISRARLFKLRANLASQGVTNVKVLNLPGEKIWQQLPGYFDKVLVDAPCSMEGRFQCSDPHSFEGWSSRKVKELSHRQKYLLWSAFSSVRIGGIIVYSTCTLSPEENEEVIDWLLKKSQGTAALEQITLSGLPTTQGLTQWKGKTYSDGISNALRVFPQPEYEGFFVARLCRIQ